MRLFLSVLAALIAVGLPAAEISINLARLSWPAAFDSSQCVSLSSPLSACWDRRQKGPYGAGAFKEIYYNLSGRSLCMYVLMASQIILFHVAISQMFRLYQKVRLRRLVAVALLCCLPSVVFSHMSLWHYINDHSSAMLASQAFFSFSEDLIFVALILHLDMRNPIRKWMSTIVMAFATFHLVEMLMDEVATPGQPLRWLRNAHLFAGDVSVLISFALLWRQQQATSKNDMAPVPVVDVAAMFVWITLVFQLFFADVASAKI